MQADLCHGDFCVVEDIRKKSIRISKERVMVPTIHLLLDRCSMLLFAGNPSRPVQDYCIGTLRAEAGGQLLCASEESLQRQE